MPLSRIRPVVDEYFREGTGFKPTQVQWTKGRYTGELYVEEDDDLLSARASGCNVANNALLRAYGLNTR